MIGWICLEINRALLISLVFGPQNQLIGDEEDMLKFSFIFLGVCVK